ncbi:MAG: MerR family transcriptional regulator [Pseudomonadota bacterium]
MSKQRSSPKKSVNAFRTISEAAEELDLPQHVLRFWESKFSIISPMKRAGGRRYYRPEDIESLRAIRTLLHDQGFTIRGVQRLIRERRLQEALMNMDGTVPPASVRNMFEEPSHTDSAPQETIEPKAAMLQRAKIIAVCNNLQDMADRINATLAKGA